MKKLLLLIALLILSLIATAQLDTTGMTAYEKYYYIKTGEIDTNKIIKKTNPKYTTIFNYKKQQKEQSKEYKEAYTEDYQEGYQTAYYLDDPFYYTIMINRFSLGFWTYPYYNYFYDPWYYSYYGWGYPYMWGYPYYSYGYINYNHRYNYRSHNYSNGNINYKNFNNTHIRRSSNTYTNKRTLSNMIDKSRTVQSRNINKSKSYTPSYIQRRTNSRPLYNNSKISSQQRTSVPIQKQTQSRYSTSSKRNSNFSKSYSMPIKNSSSRYLTPSNNSSFSRSSGNKNSYSSGHRK